MKNMSQKVLNFKRILGLVVFWVAFILVGVILFRTESDSALGILKPPKRQNAWWNPGYRYCLPALAETGLVPRSNALAVLHWDLAEYEPLLKNEPDTDSFRVVDEHNREAPSFTRISREEGSGVRRKYIIVWRIPGNVPILDSRRFDIYFNCRGRGKEAMEGLPMLTNLPDPLPGENLVSNGYFRLQCPTNSLPDGWNLRGEAVMQNVITGGKEDGASCLQLKASATVGVEQTVALEEGERYSIRCLVKTKENPCFILTMYMTGDKGRLIAGNYKYQTGLSYSHDWTTMEQSSFVYANKYWEQYIYAGVLLPGTKEGHLSLDAMSTGVVFVTAVRVEKWSPEEPVKIILGKLETRKAGWKQLFKQ